MNVNFYKKHQIEEIIKHFFIKQLHFFFDGRTSFLAGPRLEFFSACIADFESNGMFTKF